MSRACAATDSVASGEIMLFGVRVVVDSMRKSVSMNNLSQYEHPQDANNNNIKKDVIAAGYASADDAVPHNSGRHRERERKRGWIRLFDRLSFLNFNIIYIFWCMTGVFDVLIEIAVMIRSSVDGGRAQTVFGWIAEGRERWLERNLQKLRENANSDAGCEPCSEVLSPQKQPQSPSP